MSKHDLIVIGGGPGGYVAALRAAQLGLDAFCVDSRSRLGGTCLNVGCIPSKALLDSTERFGEARRELDHHGIRFGELSFDLGAMMARKEEAVEALTGGIDQLFRKHGIERVHGRGRVLGSGEVEVEPEDGETRRLRGEHVILATGSAPVELPELPIDEKRVLSSTGALALAEVPEHLVVIGAGYIGLELGSVWSRLGARTTCVEILDRILPATDVELAAELQSLLEQQELAFRLGTRVTQLDAQEGRVELRLSPAEGDVESDEKLECSHVLVAVGRRPCTEGLGLEQAGVETDERGFIRIDERFRTTLEGTFAIGDVAREPMLAHKAQDEALACVEAIAGRGSGRVHYEAIPSIVYTSPEVASVGRSEDELREQEVEFRKGRSSFRHNSRARCTAETDGFVKILADPESDRILGAHLIGPQAGTLIHEIVTAMEFGACAEELGRTCHGHPTLNEAVREAALAVHGRPIHG